MSCIGVKDELGVRETLLQYERVDSVDDDVVAAIYHHGRLMNTLEVIEGIGALSAPVYNGLGLGGSNLVADIRIAVDRAKTHTVDPLAASGLARFRGVEVDFDPNFIGRIVGKCENGLRLG